jgi:integrase
MAQIGSVVVPRMKFTEGALKALTAAPGVRETYFDTGRSGLAIRVSGPTDRRANCLKVFGVPYRHGGKQRWYTIKPSYPTRTLQEAKIRAKVVSGLVAMGRDPSVTRARRLAAPAKQVHTVATVVAAFCDVLPHRTNKTGRRLSSKHIAATTRYLNQFVAHCGNNRDIDTVEQKDILAYLDAIGAVHSVAPNRAHAALRTMYGWAEQRGLAPKGVMVGLTRVGSERARDRVLNDTEIAIVWQAATALAYPAGPFIKTLLTCGQRVGETSRVCWRHIEAESWLKQAVETKTDNAHNLPLSSLACEVLNECPQIADGYVFAGRNMRRPIISLGSLKTKLDAEITKICRARPDKPVVESWTLHDLRRTCATRLAGLGVDHRIIQKILNHAEEGVTGKHYNLHRYDAEKREALERWAKRLRDLVEPPPDNVITPPAFRAVG